MKPDLFRHLKLKPGTAIGILGEYAISGLIRGILKSYVVLERHFNTTKVEKGSVEWDTAIVMSLFAPLEAIGANAEKFVGSELLLIHHLPDFAWDNGDPVVHVFGMREGKFLGEGPLVRQRWEPKTVWLEGHAIMTVEDPSALSEISQVLRKRADEKRKMDTGV